MQYSVWDPARKQYDYYETSTVTAEFPAPKLARKDLGLSPEQAAWSLPMGAKRVGSGTQAKGMVAQPRVLGLGDSDSGSNLIGMIGLGIAGYGLYRVLK